MKITNYKLQTTNKLQSQKLWNLVIVICVLFVICVLEFGHSALAQQAGLDIAVLKAGVGARALGMGSAFTAIADNSDAPYWNPAGLSQIKFNEISTMQTRLSTDADHYYISYVQPFLNGALGISWIQVGLGNITETSTTDAYNEVIQQGIFSYYSNAYLISYGQEFNDRLSWGITAKYLTSDMASISGGQGYGYSLTPGVLFKPSDYLRIGFKIDEIVNSQKWGTGTEEIAPPKWRLGVSYRLSSLTIAGDLTQIAREGYNSEGCLGAEWKTDGLSLRLGYINDAMTAGVGFRTGLTSPKGSEVEVNYAYVNQMQLSRENVHRISLSLSW